MKRRLFATILGTFTLLIGAISAAPANASGNHVMIVGMASTQACITTSWHGPPVGNSNLDISSYNPMNQCPLAAFNDAAGRNTYWQSYRVSGNGMYAEVVPYTGSCTGVQLDVYDNSTWQALGNYWYVHISTGLGTGAWWNTAAAGYTIVWLGQVLNPDSCAAWTGPHVHQGGDNSGWTALFRNTGLPGANSIIPSTSTIHTYQW